MKVASLPGFRDSLPDDLARRRHVFGVWHEVAARYGFEEYDGPPLEPLELYTQKSGEEIVGQLYHFTDPGGREVALRPEMTPTLARLVAQRGAALRKPIRWYSVPQLFRNERQQRGRLREHFQLNMDIIGEPGPLADAELIAAAVDIMRAFGFAPADVRVRVSDRRIVTGHLEGVLGLEPHQVAPALAAIDRVERAPEAAYEMVDRAFAADRARGAAVRRFVEDLAAGAWGAEGSAPGGEAARSLQECVGHLGAMGLAGFVDVDLKVVRGLAYYTGMVFELYDAGRTLRAICGGGRYDDLLQALGGVDLPCVGFGMGDVVLGELLAARDGPPVAERPVQVWVARVGEGDTATVLALAHRLRERGIRVEYALRTMPLGKQLELASARGALFAVVIGPSERAAGHAVVRDLGTGGEMRVDLSELAESYVFEA